MKEIDLRNSGNKELLSDFKRHSEILNYSKQTIYGSERSVKEYLSFLEKRDLELNAINDTTPFFNYLESRKNITSGAGLSVAYLHKYRSSLKLFYEFLKVTKGVSIPEFPKLPKAKSYPSVLSVQQIERLFKACETSLLGSRDKALLALYYGLGLRRKEGVELLVESVDLVKQQVIIIKSKTNKQRIVPMSDHVTTILEEYVYNVREKLIPSDKSTATLLVTERGKELSASSVSYILKKILEKAKIKTPVGVHTLRHSIATHLLESGMKLESIALFLGHSSLNSTQIYTHLLNRSVK